jgi:hypothetical protein
MKKRFTVILLVLSICIVTITKADEGMWFLLLQRLNYIEMQKRGLNLTPEEIYNVYGPSLKDAVVSFGENSTGVIISSEGLLITSHHGGREYIQLNSTVKNNYLRDGFWSMSKKEELLCPGLEVSFLISMENVTDKILKKINNNMSETTRKYKIQEISEKIETEAVANTNYNAVVKSFYEGNEFYLFVYETFEDVRLVGAPPLSIGDFGGDTDNWMWPRHTGNFSMFRVYMAPDGTPAGYSKNNIPYKPKYFLPISLESKKENDFTMMLGYPTKTERYLTSYGIKLIINTINPTIIKIRSKKLAVLKAEMSGNPDIYLKYISKYLTCSNYWKFYIGQNKELKKLNAYEKEKKTEEEFQNWANADNNRKLKYGNVLKDISASYKQFEKYNVLEQYFTEVIKNGTDVTSFAYTFKPLYDELTGINDKQKTAEMSRLLIKKSIAYFKNFENSTDKKVFSSLFKMFYDYVPKDQHPDIFTFVEKKYKGNFNRFAEAVYNKSIFADKNKMWDFLNNPNAKTMENDIVFKTILSCIEMNTKAYGMKIEANWKYTKAKRSYIAGLKEMNPNKSFYPDANSTMRLSVGKISGYIPVDGLECKYYTTFDGVIQKEDADNEDFIVPNKLKELYYSKEYKKYADDDGKLKVCFISNNDVTGGNGGSPVINGDGQLIGLTFDGNEESMGCNIAFEPNLQRCINVDIRYILFIIDKYAGATNLIKEMNILEPTPKVILKPPIPPTQQLDTAKLSEENVSSVMKEKDIEKLISETKKQAVQEIKKEMIQNMKDDIKRSKDRIKKLKTKKEKPIKPETESNIESESNTNPNTETKPTETE